MATIYNLKRTKLTNVNDPAGRWQHEAGKVHQKKVQVGYYASHKRVQFGGTDAYNTVMLTMTIFFAKKHKVGCPENFTVQGAHDFSSGGQAGSVSAASSGHASKIDKNFTRVGDVVTIG